LGTHNALFAYTIACVPACVAVTSFWVLPFILLSKFLFLSSSCAALFIMKRMPLLFASLALRSKSIFLYIVIPCMMMSAFCIHAIGNQVMIYSLFWTIPMMMYCMQDTLLNRSVASSFIAHSIGSVIWLYCYDIPVHVWQSLMYIVPIERFLLALCMYGFIYTYQCILQNDSDKVWS
jgi:hypothetical protein